jgi:hypothetical protein
MNRGSETTETTYSFRSGFFPLMHRREYSTSFRVKQSRKTLMPLRFLSTGSKSGFSVLSLCTTSLGEVPGRYHRQHCGKHHE